MAIDSSAKNHLHQYTAERLPQLAQEYFENLEDPLRQLQMIVVTGR
jgi:hypothetical protein